MGKGKECNFLFFLTVHRKFQGNNLKGRPSVMDHMFFWGGGGGGAYFVSKTAFRISINVGICRITDLLNRKLFGKLGFNVVNSTTNTRSMWRSN